MWEVAAFAGSFHRKRSPFQRLALLACISSTNQNKFWGVTYPGGRQRFALNLLLCAPAKILRYAYGFTRG